LIHGHLTLNCILVNNRKIMKTTLSLIIFCIAIAWAKSAVASPMVFHAFFEKIEGSWVAEFGSVIALSFDESGNYEVKKNVRQYYGFSKMVGGEVSHVYESCGDEACGVGDSKFRFSAENASVCPLSDCADEVPITVLEITDNTFGFTYIPKNQAQIDGFDWVWTYRWEVRNSNELFYQATLTTNGRILHILTAKASR
jgi:hypothetical protein